GQGGARPAGPHLPAAGRPERADLARGARAAARAVGRAAPAAAREAPVQQPPVQVPLAGQAGPRPPERDDDLRPREAAEGGGGAGPRVLCGGPLPEGAAPAAHLPHPARRRRGPP
ncbi:unnamed protein product, partial [Heterosigma akashiwo]